MASGDHLTLIALYLHGLDYGDLWHMLRLAWDARGS